MFFKKQAKDSGNAVTRMRKVTSRIVGMHRLLTEQTIESYADLFRTTKATRKGTEFSELRSFIEREVYERLLSPIHVDQTLTRASRERGSLGEILFNSESFPKQALLISFGTVMESAIQKYLASKYSDVSGQLSPVIKGFLDKDIQLDVAVEKDNTYFVSELKYNFNLDTEKASKVVEKLDLLSITLKKFFKGAKTTNVTLVSLRYPTSNDIPKLKPELESVRGQYILGYTEFFRLFGIEVTKEEWEDMHKALGRKIIGVYSGAMFSL